MAQIRIVAADETFKKFKRIVLAKHGKLQLSIEGQEALKLYISKNERLLNRSVSPDQDSLRLITGIGRPKRTS